MTLQERIQRSQQVGAEAKQPTISTLANQANTLVPSSAYAAGAIPGTTPDQVKMMGTPAQKQAKVAQLGGETQLEQAVKLRAPAEATTEDEAKKRRAAAIAQGMGTMGDKAVELVERTFANITGQQVAGAAPAEGATGTITLALDNAAKQLEGKTPEQVTNITNLINSIATMAPGADRNAATLSLNQALGLTGANALSADMVPGLIAKLPETVAQAAAGQVKATIGEKLTVKDLGDLGTSPAELAALLGVDEAAISEMSLSDLDNALASLTQTQFGETQAVQAGIVSGVLSQAEKNALRNVLATLEERGVAGAEFQVGQVAKDIVEGRQITVGDQQYSIEELLATDEMTDIVTQVLNDEKSEFSLSLKETSPDLYNWIVSSRAGLENLVKEAGKGVGTFKTVQEKNIKLLTPFAGQKEYMKSLGINIDDFQVDAQGNPIDLTEEITVNGVKMPRWKAPVAQGGLPPAAQLLLSLPPEKQGVSLTNLSQLPADQIKDLTAKELLNLGLDRSNGLWSQYRDVKNERERLAAIPPNQINTIVSTLGWGTVDDLNKTLTDAIMIEAMGGPRHPLLDIDINKNDTLDAEDMAKLKETAASGQLPSLKDLVATGQISGAKLPAGGDALNYGGGNQEIALKGITSALADGSISEQEQVALAEMPVNSDVLQSILDRRPSGFRGAGDINQSLEVAIQRKVNKEIDDSFRSQGMSMAVVNNFLNLPALKSGVGLLDQQQRQNLTGMISKIERALEMMPSNKSRSIAQTYLNRLRQYQTRYEEAPEPISFN